MLALSSLPGLSIETRTSKLVTLSFSTPIGEICVTRPLKILSLNVSTRMRAGWPSRTRPMSASSTLPRTKTWSMSPSVITSVALAPRLRIDDTGLPISTSRVSTVARIGARMRGVGEILGGAIGRRLGLGDLGARLRHLGLADGQLRLRRALAIFRHVDRAVRIVERGLRDQLLLEQRLGALVGAARKLDVGTFGFDDVLLQLGLGAFERGLGGEQVGLGAAHLRQQLILVEFGEHVAFGHDAVDVDAQRLDDAVRLAT